MDKINTSGLVRNPDAIKKCFKQISNTVVVTKPIRVVFPQRYINKELAHMGTVVNVLSIIAILDDEGNYGVVNLPVFLKLQPSITSEIDMDGSVYIALDFNKDDIYLDTVELPRTSSMMMPMFDEFIAHGRVPWFLNYDDLSNIIINANEYAGVSIGDNPFAFELLAYISTVNEKNKLERYCMAIKKQDDIKKIKPYFIGLTNPQLSYTNTTTRVTGSYLKEGILSSLLNPSDEVTTIEEILRA